MTAENNLDGGGVYRQIFAGAGSTAQLRCAIALAVRELRGAMEKEDNPAVTAAHMRNLDDVEPAALARAYAVAEKSCTYWPSPGQIRELAGRSEAQSGQEALEWTLRYVEEHGVEGRAKGGAVTFGDDGTGRRVLLEATPLVDAPDPPTEIRRTLLVLGSGSLKQGLLYVSRHPSVQGWDETGGEASTKTAERIERQWMRSYRQALREAYVSQPTLRRTP